MGNNINVVELADACEGLFPLETLSLSESYFYDSLPLCLIDAVFSIGVKYTSTQNVVRRYCAYFGLQEFNHDRSNTQNRHTIPELVANLENAGIEKCADEIFCNHQRTSSQNGILKAEAVLRIARILQRYGVETFEDLNLHGLSDDAEAEIRNVPGQKSGLALSYFYMLAGDDSLAKPDRHILRFINQYTGQTPTVQEAQKILKQTVQHLNKTYPQLTVRLLDYAIWEHMAQGKQNAKVTTYHKLVRDRIPEIIEENGKKCVTRILSDEEYLKLIDAKLDEELAEYHKDQNIEELADLLEVIYAAACARGFSIEQLEQIRTEKAAKRGGFQEKILLMGVKES